MTDHDGTIMDRLLARLPVTEIDALRRVNNTDPPRSGVQPQMWPASVQARLRAGFGGVREH